MSRLLTKQRNNNEDEDDEEYGQGISMTENPFMFIAKNWKQIIGLVMIIAFIAYTILLLSIPEKGRVFEGTINRIDVEHIVVYVRNNLTVGNFNATYGMCYGDDVGFICNIGDKVEIAQYTSWFDEVWIVNAIVD